MWLVSSYSEYKATCQEGCDEIPPLFISHNENHEADGTIFVTFNGELQSTKHVGYGDRF